MGSRVNGRGVPGLTSVKESVKEIIHTEGFPEEFTQ